MKRNTILQKKKSMSPNKRATIRLENVINESKIVNYPKKKLILNRIFNLVTKLLFISDYNDFTNAFKIYKKSALLKTFPLVSESFNIFLGFVVCLAPG